MRPFIQTVLVLMSLSVGVQAAGAGELGIEVTFDDAEIETIRAYYRDHGSNDAHGNKHGKAKDKGILVVMLFFKSTCLVFLSMLLIV